MKIRPLADADVDALAAGLAALPLMVRYRRTGDAIAADLRRGLASGDGLLVASDGDAPAAPAYGLAWFHTHGTFALGGYLKLLAVVAGRSSAGVGAQLLDAYEQAVRERSRHAFLLVSDFNVDAQRFYERHGYQRTGALPALVLADVDELIYWKRLSP